jgi:predicted nuclease of predicted toxin-antitoxin system
MKIWVDAQISPVIATWLNTNFDVNANPLRDIGLRDAEDLYIFRAAANADAIILTKDKDFALLLQTFGSPPRVIWVTSGNTSNAALRELLTRTFQDVITLLAAGETLIEIG